MNILLVGSGAREHAIAHALNNSPQEKNIFCLASNMNPGLSELCTEIKIDDINDPKLVSSYALKIGAAIAIVGPENPLAMGVADALWAMGTKVVGPKKNLAQIETSKAFARDLLTEYGIPACPEYRTFSSMDGVLPSLQALGENYVVKYDGLAGGKGVKVAGDHLHSHNEATEYCQSLVGRGGKFIIEEKLIGQEFSLMSFCDGNSLKHMPAVQDHKRAYEGDIGPNTGGMGAYSPSFLITAEVEEKIKQKIIEPTLKGMKEIGCPYKGILYAGLMIENSEPKLIEYNIRFGDPECQILMMRLENDLIDLITATFNKTLLNKKVSWTKEPGITIVAASKGYPGNFEKLKEIKNIHMIKSNNKKQLFHAGTIKKNDGKIYSHGGRVLNSTVVDTNLETARNKALEILDNLDWSNKYYRRDIGYQVIDK